MAAANSEFMFDFSNRNAADQIAELYAHVRGLELAVCNLAGVLHQLSPQILEPIVRQARLDYQAAVDRPSLDRPRDRELSRRMTAARLFALETPLERSRLLGDEPIQPAAPD